MFIRIIKLLFLIINLHSKGLERSMGDMGAKKRHYMMFLIGFWHSERNVIMECLNSLTFLFSLYLNKTFKICSIDWNLHYNTYWLKS